MSKVCEYCGAELNGAEKFCPKCGAPAQTVAKAEVKTEANKVEGVKSTVNTTETKPKKSKKGLVIGIVVFLIVAAIVAGCVYAGIKLFGSSYKKPLDYFCTAIEKGDSKTWIKMYPDCMKEDIDEENLADGLEYMQESFEDEFGKNYKVTYKVTKKEKLDKDELKEIQEILEEEYGKGKKTKITAGYTLTVDLKIKGKEDEDTAEDKEIVVLKIGGKWCLIQDPLNYNSMSKSSNLLSAENF